MTGHVCAVLTDAITLGGAQNNRYAAADDDAPAERRRGGKVSARMMV
jgi:hypothetical protein